MTLRPEVYLEAVGLAAPGLSDWQSAVPVLRGERAFELRELPSYQPTSLPPNERRRASSAVRMAFAAAEQATRGRDASTLATVFASADGDLGIAERICRALAAPQRMVSPTDFHASVHNSAAGNWAIAAAATGPSTAVAGYEDCLAIGLMEAMGMVLVENAATLLVAFDLQPPHLLAAQSFANRSLSVALLLMPQRSGHSLARIHLVAAGGIDAVEPDAALEKVCRGGPAARCIPLLQTLARREHAVVGLPFGPAGALLSVSLEPC
jgi:hypothetical protein